jgi:hypothetical protein
MVDMGVSGIPSAGLKADMLGAAGVATPAPSNIGHDSPALPLEAGELESDAAACLLFGFWAPFLLGPLYPRREATY